jgi:hypothetical protein
MTTLTRSRHSVPVPLNGAAANVRDCPDQTAYRPIAAFCPGTVPGRRLGNENRVAQPVLDVGLRYPIAPEEPACRS